MLLPAIAKKKELEMFLCNAYPYYNSILYKIVKATNGISNNGIVNNKITFSSSYFCYKFLPKQIIMERLNDK